MLYIMKSGKNFRNPLVGSLIVLSVLSSCIPHDIKMVLPTFVNCTSDTLYIGASRYDYIDSVEVFASPLYGVDDNNIDTIGISLWMDRITELENGARIYIKAQKDAYIYPDSTCVINIPLSFNDIDTCYLFLVKWRDAKEFSWDDIRTKNLFNKWIFTKDSKGKYERNIKYLDSIKN